MSCAYRSGYGYPVRGCQEPVWPGNEFFIQGCDNRNVMGIRCDNPLKVGGAPANTSCTYSFPKGYFMSPSEKRKFQWGW